MICTPFLLFLCGREKIDMALRLFTALKEEDQSLHLTIQDTIICLASAYKVFFK